MPPRVARCSLFLVVLASVTVARADPQFPEPPVRASLGEQELYLETDAVWMTAELSVPGWEQGPVVLGPSFPGARWVLPFDGSGDNLQLTWVAPDGAGVSLSLPLAPRGGGAKP